MIYHAIEVFLTAKSQENKSPATLEFYRRRLRNFARAVGDVELTSIQPSAIRQHLADEQARASVQTSAAAYRSLLAFFTWCEDEPELGKPPSPFYSGRRKIIRPPNLPDTEPNRAAPEQVVELIESIKPLTWIDLRDKAIITLLYATGMRRAELVSLTLGDVNVVKRRLIVTGKGSKERVLPFNEAAQWLLFGYLCVRPPVEVRPSEESPPMFVGLGGSRKGLWPLSGNGVYQMVIRRCRRASVEYLTPHAFRHGAATMMLNVGADKSFVQRMLGHSSSVMTDHYARWAIDDLQRVYDRIWVQHHDCKL